MLRISFCLFTCFLLFSCNNETKLASANTGNFSGLLENYFQERMALLPLESTQNGDSTHNDALYPDFTDSYRMKLKTFFTRYRDSLKNYDRDKLDANDKISFDILQREMQLTLDGLDLGYFGTNVLYPAHQYMPFDQFEGLPIMLGQLGSGEGSQPFKTVADYDNWIRRAGAFPAWCDSAIVYFKKGMASGIVLPAALVKKMLPQMESMVVSDPQKSLFWGPIGKLPKNFPDSTRERIRTNFDTLIRTRIVPSYKKLGDFLKNEYLPSARASTGLGALAKGNDYYHFLIRYWTTTNKTPDEIYETGRNEVARIRAAMDSVRQAVGFKGDLPAFFQYMKTDSRFMPFKTPEDVLNAFRAIQARITPNLQKMFHHVPKSPFEIRQTEAFRAASASAEYMPGTADGSRPGIFYVPILDAKTYNTTSGFESLFLHEAIPGHHYQISLQQENTALPKFRRYAWYGAFGEGWALYCESLGKELGLYTDPYQYMGALGDEIHRAIRLVVDVGMHTRNMSREEAIRYMMDNEAISEEGATAEIERYMAIPAQALSYKIGALKIRELRNRYESQLGSRFVLADFHDELLKDGVMPLEIAERKMDEWEKNER